MARIFLTRGFSVPQAFSTTTQGRENRDPMKLEPLYGHGLNKVTMPRDDCHPPCNRPALVGREVSASMQGRGIELPSHGPPFLWVARGSITAPALSLIHI